MNTLNFSQSEGCTWLYLANDELVRVLFLLPPDSVDLPEQISLTESWENFPAGCYVFLRQALAAAEQTEFARAAWVFLSDPTRRERPGPAAFTAHTEAQFAPRFAWFSNPGEAASGLSGQSISLYRDDGTAPWRSDRLNSFAFDDHVLRIVKDCIVTLKPDKSGFDFSPPHDFDNEYQSREVPPVSPLVATLLLVMNGENTGAFLLTNKLSNGGEIGPFIQILRPEIRYFFKGAGGSHTDAIVISQSYPILSDNPADWAGFKGELVSRFYLYPNQTLDDHRIIISHTAPDDSLPSHFRSNLGYPVHLVPVGDFNLIYAYWTDTSGEGQSKHYYLTLEGEFEISIPGNAPSAPDNLTCGLSGVEYIGLSRDKTNILTFIPGQPAFAPSFSLQQSQEDGRGAEKLTKAATTAWVYVSQIEPDSGGSPSYPLYFAQPDQAVLYRPFEDRGTGEFLEYMDVPAAALPARTKDLPAMAFPIAPYGSVDSALIENYQKFETGLLSPARRVQIQQITSRQTLPLVDTPRLVPQTGTTPQGLLATYSGDFETLQSMVLARDTENRDLKFENVLRVDPLRSALQSNQLFLVISDPGSIKRHFVSNLLAITDWTFNLNPDAWKDHRTLLVFKFHNHSLRDLVSATQAWTMADEFSVSPATDSIALGEIFQQALDKIDSVDSSPQDKENYSQLAQAIRNPRWNGILAFNVSVPPGGLPAELLGLTSGIDQSRFCARYVGIASSIVHTTAEGALQIQQSSLFGLIDYVDDGGVSALDSGYNFAVSKLNVLFQNSQVKHFAAQVILVLDKLFGDDSVLQNSPSGRNEILLAGRCESHDGRNTYSFSSNDFSRFDLPKSPIIDEVEIVKTQFSTDPPANSSSFADGELVKSRFVFWGRLDFTKWSDKADPLKNFDLLSFGSEPGESGGGASFSNLQVISTFPWKATGNTDQTRDDSDRGKTYIFKADEMIFNLSKSKWRGNSLFAKFPLKVIGMVEGDGSDGQKTPDSLGFMPVRTPMGGNKPEDGKPWFGLIYDLNLGSAGALAGKAGIVVSLLAAWQPGADAKVYTGLRLPGSSGGKKEISIQGILKIAFKSIEFRGPTNTTGYVLKLRHIVLKFMILELPPNAQSEIIIFGDPEGKGGEDSLAWYAAYASSKDKLTAPATTA